MLKHFSLQSIFNRYKIHAISHRYITNRHIEPLLKMLDANVAFSTIGYSVNGLPIYGIQLGKGNKRVLMWSQMHGNESTTTKACFDLLNYLADNAEILNSCSLYIIPILNPDGAKAYTRVNANGIDLNRDAQDLTQPESLVLKSIFESFNPHFCFNLHGQRTIFSAGNNNKSAIISFLAPAQDEACTVTENRKIAMEIIASMNDLLQNIIPNGVGIYDDAFNINCVGDTFQSKNVPTVLFEAGHYTNDYSREVVRKLIFGSLLNALETIVVTKSLGINHEPYFKIPQNERLFYDIIIRNAKVLIESKEEIVDIAFQYEEVLSENQVNFVPKIINFGNLSQFFGHNEIDASNNLVLLENDAQLVIDNSIDFVTIKNELFSLNLENN